MCDFLWLIRSSELGARSYIRGDLDPSHLQLLVWVGTRQHDLAIALILVFICIAVLIVLDVAVIQVCRELNNVDEQMGVVASPP